MAASSEARGLRLTVPASPRDMTAGGRSAERNRLTRAGRTGRRRCAAPIPRCPGGAEEVLPDLDQSGREAARIAMNRHGIVLVRQDAIGLVVADGERGVGAQPRGHARSRNWMRSCAKSKVSCTGVPPAGGTGAPSGPSRGPGAGIAARPSGPGRSGRRRPRRRDRSPRRAPWVVEGVSRRVVQPTVLPRRGPARGPRAGAASCGARRRRPAAASRRSGGGWRGSEWRAFQLVGGGRARGMPWRKGGRPG